MIRPAHESDLAAIRDLAYAIWPDTYGNILSAAQLAYMLDSFYSPDALTDSLRKGHRYLLVETDVPVGFVAYQHGYEGRAVTRIHKIYVLPQTQGTGIGRELISHVEALARSEEAQLLSLNVNRLNKAIGFYEKMGFEIVARQDIAIGHGYLMEDYRMEKKL